MSAAVSLKEITKRYGSTLALNNVTFELEAGAVHALLGENGAGKSTLVKVLSGLVRPDSGDVSIFGTSVQSAGRTAASLMGVETAFQEIPLVPDLSVADNLLLPNQPIRFGVFLDRSAAARKASAICDELELSDIDTRKLVRELDLSLRQKVEIARALARKPRLLILDEPTAALSKADVDWLGRRIDVLKDQGTTVILVTHRMREVHDFCSHMTILRSGQHIGSYRVGVMSDAEVFEQIMGRSVETTFPPRHKKAINCPPLLSATRVGAGGQLQDVSIDVHANEIVGVAALQGMGQLELFNALFGVEVMTTGSLEIDGHQVTLSSPARAIDCGIGYIPEDRKLQGLALNRNGRENASLAILNSFSRFGMIDRRKEASSVDRSFARVNLHPRALYQNASEFSGGNQQKMVVAKWLLTQCRLLLAFDPTRGVDVGTKHEIYGVLRGFADAGGGVLLHSTEVPELVGLCDRIVVLYRGRLVAQLSHREASEQAIGAWMLGSEAMEQAVA